MKNKILSLMAFVSIIAGLSSCDKDTTDGYTRITYFPTLKVLGESVIIVDKGSVYVDAGCYAELKGEDVTDQVTITSDVNTSEAGIYSVIYEIYNSDGFLVTGKRTVYVADPTPSVITTGVHYVASGTNRVNNTTGATTPYSGYPVIFLQTEPGIFYVTDFLGGYYDKRAGYGSNYAMTGFFKINDDYTLSLISSSIIGWGDSLDEMTSGSVNPTTGEITWSVSYAGSLIFNVIIN